MKKALFLMVFVPFIVWGDEKKQNPTPPQQIQQSTQPELDQLYRLKGMLTTQIELTQSQLADVNKRIVEILTQLNKK